MSLSAFIRDHHEEIIAEFAAFAKTLMQPNAVMTEAELRDHAEEILTELSADLATEQSDDEQSKKSKGLGTANLMRASSRLHADTRIKHGYSLLSVLAEFRALRASVLKLYESSGETDLRDVRRFNESIDEALMGSTGRFTDQTDLFRNRFIGILSHDLRDPLNAIGSSVAILAIPEDNPQRRAKMTALMLHSCDRMNRLVADLLDLTRTQLGGTIPLTRRIVDLQEICEGILTETRAAHSDAIIRFEKVGDVAGEWDADRLTQLVANLVRNAIQHGGGTPITIVAKDEGNAVKLTVHNGGEPIPPGSISSIFEPLARRVDDGLGHSLGLGLFIARVVVEAHGGKIDVNSSRDEGTTFTVDLPKKAPKRAAASG